MGCCVFSGELALFGCHRKRMLNALALPINAGPSPLPLSHLGEGFPALNRCRRDNLSPPSPPRLSSPHLVPEGQPSGGMPLAGRGRRLRVGLRPTPGRLRGTALGVLRPLCEELAGRDGGTASAGPGRDKAGSGPKSGLSPFRDHPLHETKEIAQASLPNWRRGPQVSATPCRISAARRLKSPASGAPRGVRMVAQSIRAASWLNGSGPRPTRLAALRCPSFKPAAPRRGGALA
ncbi:hypothetical protein BO1005MUT1_210186 [Hyphomicrobiales bacterium]|nr:hypothetical protein BO1005MUT1_210186 [Hyphomicrobiales bacterium]